MSAEDQPQQVILNQPWDCFKKPIFATRCGWGCAHSRAPGALGARQTTADIHGYIQAKLTLEKIETPSRALRPPTAA